MTELATPTRAFVLGLADRDGVIDAASLYDAAAAVGFSDTKLRLTLRRLAEAGLVESEGRGRNARWWLTDAGHAERATDLTWVAMAHRIDGGLDRWDGTWHLVSFEIPERQRSARDALRGVLTDLFAAPLGGGLYVSPWPLRPWISPVVTEHDIVDRVTHVTSDRLDVGGRTDPAEIAGHLWPVAALGPDYRSFIDTWSAVASAPPSDEADAVRVAFEASAAIESILRADPVLPPELLPADFAGPAARALYRRLLRSLDAHEVIARANVFGAYEAEIERSLSESTATFWARVTG